MREDKDRNKLHRSIFWLAAITIILTFVYIVGSKYIWYRSCMNLGMTPDECIYELMFRLNTEEQNGDWK